MTSSKITPLKVSAKVSRITTTANAHHKTTNASQDYEFHTMGNKNSVKDLVFICSIQYKDIIPFQLRVPVLKWFKAPTAWFELNH